MGLQVSANTESVRGSCATRNSLFLKDLERSLEKSPLRDGYVIDL